MSLFKTITNPILDTVRSFVGQGILGTTLRTSAGFASLLGTHGVDATKQLPISNQIDLGLKIHDKITGRRTAQIPDILRTNMKTAVRDYNIIKRATDLSNQIYTPQNKAEQIAGNLGAVGTSIAAALSLPTLAISIGGQAGIASREAYDLSINRGESEKAAEEASRKTALQSLAVYGLSETAAGALFRGVGGLAKIKYGNLTPMKKLVNILDQSPAARFSASAIGEGTVEGLQEQAVRNIQQEALEGDYFNLGDAAYDLATNKEAQGQFLENFIYGAVGFGGLKGIVRLTQGKSKPATEEVASKVSDSIIERNLIPNVAGDLARMTPKEQSYSLSLATYAAVIDKNQHIPEAAVYATLEKYGKGDDLNAALLAIEEGKTNISAGDFGTMQLPTQDEVVIELAKMEGIEGVYDQIEQESAENTAFQQEYDTLQQRNIDAQELSFRGQTEGGVLLQPALQGEETISRGSLEDATDLPDGTVLTSEEGVRSAIKEKKTARVRSITSEIAKKLPSLEQARKEGRINFVENYLIDGIARGKYTKGKIDLSSAADVSTVAHEAWHDFFDNGMSADEQRLFNRAIHQKHQDTLNNQVAQLTEENTRNNLGKTEQQIMREAELEVGAILAEDFVKSEREPKTFIERIVSKLKNLITDVLSVDTTLLDTYRQFYGDQAENRFFREQDQDQKQFYDNNLQNEELDYIQSGQFGISPDLYQRAEEEYSAEGYTTKMIKWLDGQEKKTMSINELQEKMKSKTLFDGGALSQVEKGFIKDFITNKTQTELLDKEPKRINLESLSNYLKSQIGFRTYASDSFSEHGLEYLVDDSEKDNFDEFVYSPQTNIVQAHDLSKVAGEHTFADEGGRTSKMGNLGWWRSFIGFAGKGYFVSEVQSDTIPKLKEGEAYNKYKNNYIDILLNRAAKHAKGEGYPEMFLPTAETIAKIEGFGLVNDFTPVERLRELAKSSNYDVRVQVGLNINTPPDILEMLSKDNMSQVRAATSSNKNTPKHVLEKLIKDSDSYVRNELVKNINLPDNILKELSQDTESYVRINAETRIENPLPTEEEIASSQDNITRQYTEGGRIHNAYKKVFGKLEDLIDQNGNTWYKVDVSGFGEPMQLYQRTEMFSNWLQETNQDATPDNIATELTKYLLRSKTAEPREFNGKEYYPIYISTGNDLTGDSESELINGYFSIEGNKIDDLTIERYGEKDEIIGNILANKWSPAFTGKLMDTITKMIRQGGYKKITLSDNIQPITRRMIEQYYGQTGTIDITKKPIFDESYVQLDEPLYQREKEDSEVQKLLKQEGITDQWLEKNDLVKRSSLKRLIFFGKNIKDSALSLASDITRTQGSRIGDIDSTTSGKLTKVYFDSDEIFKQLVGDETLFTDLQKEYNKLSAKERQLLNLYLIRQDKESIEKAGKILDPERIQQLREVFDRSHSTLKRVGYEVNKVDFYLPRKVKQDGKKIDAEDMMTRFYTDGITKHFKKRTREAKDITADNITDYEPPIQYASEYLRSVSRFIATQSYFNDIGILDSRGTLIKTEGSGGNNIVQKTESGAVDLPTTLNNKWKQRADELLAETYVVSEDGSLIDEKGNLIQDYSFKGGKPVDKNDREITAKQHKYALEAYENFVENKGEWKRLVGRLFAPKDPNYIKNIKRISALKTGGYGLTLAQPRIAARASFENIARSWADTSTVSLATGIFNVISGGKSQIATKKMKDYILDREKVESEQGLRTEQVANKLFGYSGWRLFKEKAVEVQKHALLRDFRQLAKKAQTDPKAQTRMENKYRLDVLPQARRKKALEDLLAGEQNYDVNMLIFQAESRSEITSPLQRTGWSSHYALGNMLSMMKTDLFKGYDFAATKTAEPLKLAKKNYDKETKLLVDEEMENARKAGRQPNFDHLDERQLKKLNAYVSALYNFLKVFATNSVWYAGLYSLDILFRNSFKLLQGDDEDLKKGFDRLVTEAVLRQSGISPYDLYKSKTTGELEHIVSSFADVTPITTIVSSVSQIAKKPEESYRKVPLFGDVVFHWFHPQNEKNANAYEGWIKGLDLDGGVGLEGGWLSD